MTCFVYFMRVAIQEWRLSLVTTQWWRRRRQFTQMRMAERFKNACKLLTISFLAFEIFYTDFLFVKKSGEMAFWEKAKSNNEVQSVIRASKIIWFYSLIFILQRLSVICSIFTMWIWYLSEHMYSFGVWYFVFRISNGHFIFKQTWLSSYMEFDPNWTCRRKLLSDQ